MIDDRRAIGRRDDRQRFVLFGQRQFGARRRCGEGRDAGNGLDDDPGRQLANDARQMAEGGEGRGVALDQEDEIASFGEQRHRRLGRAQPGLGENFRIARHREDKRHGVGRRGQSAAFDDGQRIGRLLGLLHRVEPTRARLERGPGAAGNEFGIAGAERGADQFAVALRFSHGFPCSYWLWRSARVALRAAV